MSRTVVFDALVLRMVDHAEKHRIVTLFTAEHGRIATLARGARGSKRRFGGHMDIFHRGEATLAVPRREGGIAPLIDFKATHQGESIRTDIPRFAAASFFVELVLSATAAGDVNPGQFELLADTLKELGSGDVGVRRDLVIAFQLRWFDTMGLLPPLDTQSLIDEGLPPLDGQPLAIARALSTGVLIPDLDPERFFLVGRLTGQLRRRILGAPLSSLRFLHEMLAPE